MAAGRGGREFLRERLAIPIRAAPSCDEKMQFTARGSVRSCDDLVGSCVKTCAEPSQGWGPAASAIKLLVRASERDGCRA